MLSRFSKIERDLRPHSQALSTYYAILNNAKQFSIEELDRLQNEGVCIDIRCIDQTPILELAHDGEIEAVNFLLDHFSASMQEAITGYAMAGNEMQVDHLLDQGAFALDAIRGYARGGHAELSNNLIKKNLQDYHQSLDIECELAALEGYCHSRNNAMINEKYDIIYHYAKEWIGFINQGQFYVHKIAIQGHRLTLTGKLENSAYNKLFFYDYEAIDYVLKMMSFFQESHTNVNPHRRLYSDESYRNAGNAIRNHRRVSPSGAPYDHPNVVAYAFAGHYDIVNTITSRFGKFKLAIFGYAAGGHGVEVAKLLKKKNMLNEKYEPRVSAAIAGYARFGHIKQAEKLIEHYPHLILVLLMNLYVGGYLTNKKIVIRTLLSINNSKIREHIVKLMYSPSIRDRLSISVSLQEPTHSHATHDWLSYLSKTKLSSNKLMTQEFILYQLEKQSLILQKLAVIHHQHICLAELRGWKNPRLRDWMLCSSYFIKKTGIPRDIFNIITASAFNHQVKDIQSIYDILCIPIFINLLKSSLLIFQKEQQSQYSFTYNFLINSFNLLLNFQESSPQLIEPNSINAGVIDLTRAEEFHQKIVELERLEPKNRAQAFSSAVHAEHSSLIRSANVSFFNKQAHEYLEIIERAVKRL